MEEQPLRLLVADDDEVDRLAVRRALLKAGLNAQLVEVGDGASALSALLEQSFDCALLDFQMPGQDGLSVLRQARAALVETPIIMLTGQGDEHIAVELMKAGATDYLGKAALTPERLTHLLRQAQRLHEAEQQYRTLAEVLPHTIWTSRPNGELDYISRRGFEDSGMVPGDPSLWPKAVHPDDLPRLMERWQHSLRTGEPYEIDVRIWRKSDGAWRWHLVRALPTRDARGRVVRWFGTNADIDDQRRAQERASRLQAVTAALSEAPTPRQVIDVIITQGVTALDAQSGAVCLMAEDGQSLELASATDNVRNMTRGLERIPLDAPLAVTEAVREDRLVLFTNREERDRRYPTVARLDLPYEAAAVMPLRGSRGVMGALVVNFFQPRTLSLHEQEFCLSLARQGAQALERARLYEAAQQARTAAEESEAQLRSVLAERERMEATLQERDERLRAALWASGTGTFRWDIRTGALEWDENLDQLYGLPPGRTVQMIEDLYPLVHPEDRAEVERRNGACAREGADFEMDYRVVWPDGRVHWLSSKGKTFVDANGRPLYMTGACVDITAQKRQEAEARQLAEFERQILGIVSHDLRNPLSVIRISASMLLAREGLDERASKNLTRIISASDRATRLIRDLLDFSQARLGGGIPVERKRMDLFELARGVVEELAASHPERQMEMAQEGEGAGEWDGDRLAQVLGNLVGNALQHSPPETPVRVSCRGESGQVLLEVHNQGTPIEASLLPDLFEPFRRGRHAGNGAGSVGLGLYITRQLVLAHGGGITVTSRPGEGTRFTVRLPRRAPTPPPVRGA
ncbi:PAS domain-containing protein [Archangium violaceum]|uniref:PAS domain-containing protein n=1 Tax=Archangium violaceum TaxID=83451 RepID=UPI00193B6818|nr:PAS domain-containing protein [Archangium violaceum]QRK13046.1 PAS domain-containing protein [Archangium violaceum]